jgi:hypothetical protein
MREFNQQYCRRLADLSTVRKTHLLSRFYTKNVSFHQDRLGTNIEKTQGEIFRFP